MDNQKISPFINAGMEVIQELMKEKAETRPAQVKEKTAMTQGIVVIIGFAGKLVGRMILDVSPEMAHRISETVLQESIDQSDLELIESSIAEFGNMIAGRALTKLKESGVDIRITPPTIFKGKNLQILDKDLQMIIIPYHISTGDIYLNIAVKNNA